uniref:Uncharacterized protein n=1 Tax=Candidozyma auris TaxID=498019 RepID=A0A0L0NYM5_CANAR
MSKTSVIISHLSKHDFVKELGEALPLSDKVKLAVLTHKGDQFDDLLPLITHWLSLPFLNRIVIILATEDAAAFVHAFLQLAILGQNPSLQLPSTAKILLQENLLLALKLSDNLHEAKDLDVTKSLERFRSVHAKGDYQEPEPQKLPELGVAKSYDAIDLQKLGLDSAQGVAPPTPPLERSRLVTRTLFKPSLKVNTSGAAPNDAPVSPTITLDES